MVKFGYYKCDECGKEVKKSQKSRHKRFKMDEIIKCPVCGVKVSNKNYNDHYRRCRSKEYWLEHRYKFLYILKVVSKFNLEMKRRCYIGSRFEKQYYLDKNGIRGSVKKNQKFLSDLANEREKKSLESLRKGLEVDDIELDNIYTSEAIKDSVTHNFPGISARQLIFDFLRNRGLGDNELIERVDMKLYKRDYPTDDELKENEYLFKKIMKLRQNYDYYDYFERFYFMLLQCYETPENVECEYCHRFYVDLKNHMKKCNKFEEAFYTDKRKVMSKYMRKFYNTIKWPIEKEVYFLNYYEQYSAKYFVETIGKHIKDRITFIRKIEYGRMIFKQEHGLRQSGRQIVEEIINAVRSECGLQPRDFGMNKYKFQEIDKEIYSDSDEDSDSILSMIRNVDDKEDLKDEASIESYKPVFKRIPEKEVKTMKNMLMKKKENVKNEEKKDEILVPKSDNEDDIDPILKLPEQKDDENLEDYFKKVDKHLNN